MGGLMGQPVSSCVPVLYTDAALLVGAHLVGVTDGRGSLLMTRRVETTMTDLAEMEGVLLGIECIEGPCGVLLTDSLNATKFLGGSGTEHPQSRNLDALLALRERAKAAWPKGWTIAWVAGPRNRAHHPLMRAARKEPDAFVRRLPDGRLVLGQAQ